jgi:hypothetical protein
MIDPLQALIDSALKPNPFPPTSRYYGVKTATRLQPDGTTVVYLQRRFVPGSERFTIVQEHQVSSGERIDHLGDRYVGDPEQYWRLCDANDALRPDSLTEQPGSIVKIGLPDSATGVPVV